MYSAYKNSHGDIVSHPTACAKNYLKYVLDSSMRMFCLIGSFFCRTKFGIDVVSSFPVDLIVLTMSTQFGKRCEVHNEWFLT